MIHLQSKVNITYCFFEHFQDLPFFFQLVILQNKLFPAIYLYWQRYQTLTLAKLKDIKDGITIAGDGRHDSMGHSAKYCAYTIFCCTIPMIIHFSLVQVSIIEFTSLIQCIHCRFNLISCLMHDHKSQTKANRT